MVAGKFVLGLAAAVLPGLAMSVETTPYGTWRSPLSAAATVAASAGRPGNLSAAGGRVYWTESRPAEGGRNALVAVLPGATPVELTSSGANVRTRVHEYGGAPYVVAGDHVYYSQFDDQRLYELRPGHKRRAVTAKGLRYADCAVLRASPAPVLACVREEHLPSGEVRNALVRLDTAREGAGEVLYGESDFVSSPRVSPDGKRLAFVVWDHPNMPWDTTRLIVGDLAPGGLKNLQVVAGGEDESVQEPRWAADGTLYFVSDRSDFWNLYRLGADGAAQTIAPRAAEFAGPAWNFGQANYALLSDRTALVRYGIDGRDRLAVLDLVTQALTELPLPYATYEQLTRLDDERAVLVADSATGPSVVLVVDATQRSATVLHAAKGATAIDGNGVSTGEAIEFPTTGGRTAHAFYYAPRNPGFSAPPGTLPPLIALVHGGPTAQATPDYSPAIQFWTSRGFAVVDVNYGGSSGYGRAYRQRLNGQWGVVDVEDVQAAVRYLISTGRADPQRTAIRGGSAGGYTVLLALATSDVFRAGADYYGISDMTALAKDTHKFESRYLDTLIGPLPQAQALYDARSPLNHLDGFRVPLIVFQGADDPVVPPSQSERIVNALRARSAPVAYLLFPGESHGFRRSENIVRALESELAFYGRVFGFRPADELPLLSIENLAPP